MPTDEPLFISRPVTAWWLAPINLTAHIPLWELRPWYAATQATAKAAASRDRTGGSDVE